MAQNGMLSDVDIKAQLTAPHGADLRIDKWEEDFITPVGYDIRAGDTVFSYENKQVRSLKGGGTCDVAPGDTIFISSLETVILSEKIGGFTVSRLGPQLNGLQLAALSVDPTWQGELLIILTNLGRKPVTLKYGEPLMTLCLFWMSSASQRKVDRARWDNKNIMEQFREIEKAASYQQTKRRASDLLALIFLTGGIVWLRQKGFFETNVNSVMLWSSYTALYFSLVRKGVFGLLKLYS